tara:strand:+ start:375 stop:1256 length:882 start_codon:yes stop_codon:yes gene_type:complete
MAGRRQASAPVRVDLAGGWTDVDPYPRDFGGEVVNFAINRRIRASIGRNSGPEDIQLAFEVPRGSGLGTSSAMNVAVAGLLPDSLRTHESLEELAEMAFDLESEEGVICGRQDHWVSARGGFNHLLFIGDSVEIMPFEPSRSAKMWLHKHLLLVYSGESRDSREMQKKVWERYSEGNKSVIDGLHMIRAAARPMANGLQLDRRDMVVDSLRRICEGVDLIDPSIHDPFRSVVEPLIDNGSLAAWKALGAGGGGCAGLLCANNSRDVVHSRAEEAGWEVIEWDYEEQGFEIIDE